MGTLGVSYDSKLNQYVIPALIIRRSNSEFTNIEMIVDTGSNTSAISEETAEKLGFKVLRLPRREVMGIGAYTEERIVTEPLELVVGEALGIVELKETFVYLPLNKKYRKKVGVKVQRGEKRVPAPNIFGMDALSNLSGKPGRLWIDTALKTGTIEWDGS